MQLPLNDRRLDAWIAVGLIPVAGGVVHAAILAARSLGSIPPAFDDPMIAAFVFAVTAGKTAFTALALMLPLALAPRLAGAIPVAPGAVASCILAVLLTSNPHPDIRLSHIVGIAACLGLVTALGFGADRLTAGHATWRRFLLRLPALTIAAGCWAAAFYWLMQHSLKTLAREHPWVVAAAYAAVATIGLLPFLRRADLDSDPDERADVIDQARVALEVHERTAAGIRKEYGLDGPPRDQGADEELMRRMRSLGYL